MNEKDLQKNTAVPNVSAKERYFQEIFNTPPLSLEEVLLSREQRVQRQQKLMSKGGTLISFTMNIAGAVKRSPLFSQAFAEGKRRILRQLHYERAEILAQEEYSEKTGDELYILTDTDIVTIKRLMTEIEDGFAMGRLYDIDVMTAQIPKISRKDIGFAPRRCLLCENQAAACARSRAHSIESILAKTVEIICDYFAEEYATTVAQTACRALLYEVHTAPKPGLVDRENNGSHRDMNEFTFIDSACTLYPYFKKCALKGIELGQTPQKLFYQLRYLGKEAEDRMKQATNGVNTHKGAIFSMGIFCAAAGSLMEKGIFSIDEFQTVCREMCGELMKDFSNLEKKAALSYGERLYQQYGITGIRGEASQGFPSVLEIGLPTLERELSQRKNLNDAAAVTLLTLIEQVQDTNIIIRSDVDTLHWAQHCAGEVLSSGAQMQQIRRLDQAFIEKNISPGGCADLLSLSLFLYFWKNRPAE